jgi:hypothetical protein
MIGRIVEEVRRSDDGVEADPPGWEGGDEQRTDTGREPCGGEEGARTPRASVQY